MRDVGSGQRGRLGLGRLGGAKMWMSHTLGHSEAPEKRSFINTSTRRAIKFYLRCTVAAASARGCGKEGVRDEPFVTQMYDILTHCSHNEPFIFRFSLLLHCTYIAFPRRALRRTVYYYVTPPYNVGKILLLVGYLYL